MQEQSPSSGLTAIFTAAGTVGGGLFGAFTSGGYGAALFAPFGMAVGYIMGGSIEAFLARERPEETITSSSDDHFIKPDL